MITALNGRDALQLINDSTAPYDLILLDLRMPDMDGVEFIEALRKSGHEFDSIPIVLTTAEPEDSSLLQHARALGVSAVVRKPWRPNELREVIRQVIPDLRVVEEAIPHFRGAAEPPRPQVWSPLKAR